LSDANSSLSRTILRNNQSDKCCFVQLNSPNNCTKHP
jgi:hypothetical protein